MSEPGTVRVLQNASDTLYATYVCPWCGVKGVIDREQYEGKISILCDCGYHETVDLRKASKKP